MAEQRSGPRDPWGTVVVFDEFDVEHRDADGLLAFTLHSGDSHTYHEVEVYKGQWRLERLEGEKPCVSLIVRQCIIGERRASPQPQDSLFSIPPDGRVDLKLRWLKHSKLHVRASDSGRELEDVVLCELPTTARGSRLDTEYPGPEVLESARAVGASPVLLEEPKEPGTRIIFGHSEGYAWGRIQVDSTMVEATLVLNPAGTLGLGIRGNSWSPEVEVTLASVEHRPRLEYLNVDLGETRHYLLKDLPAGRYVAEGRNHGRLIGMVELAVVAGRRIDVTLDLGTPPTLGAPLEGTLKLPREWQIDDFVLHFWLKNRFEDGALDGGSFQIPSAAMTHDGGVFHWSVPFASRGRYTVELPPALFSTEFEVGAEESRTAVIVVPSPGTVSVRCVDERNGVVLSEGVSFATLSPALLHVWRCASLPEGIFPSPQRFQVPQGEVLIWTEPNDYDSTARIVDVCPGLNELVLRLRPRDNEYR